MPCFSDFIGSDGIRERMGKVIRCGKLSHAYIIEGRSGSGKRTFATLLAAAANCEHRHDPQFELPCRACPACRKILSGNAPDLHMIDRGDKATIGVETIRDMRNEAMLSSTELDTRVFIISDADAMTVAAQNALLILLEEPPEGVLLLLLSESSEHLLTTIRSRAQTLALGYIEPNVIREHLIACVPEAARMHASDPEKLHAICVSANGRIGEAKRMLAPKSNAELFRRRELVLALVKAIAEMRSYSAVLSAVTALPTKRAELANLFPMILDAMRDLCVCRRAEDTPMLFFPSADEAIKIASAADYRRLICATDAIVRVRDDIAANANVAACLTALATSVYTRL